MKKRAAARARHKAPGQRVAWLRWSAVQILAACLFIGFLSFALAFGVLGAHHSSTAEPAGATSASPGALEGGGATSADGTTGASPAAAGATSPDLLAAASPGAGGSAGTTPDLVTSPSTAAGGGGGGGTSPSPDLVTSPSTAAPVASPGAPPDLVTSPSAPTPSPTTPPDTVTQPSSPTPTDPGTTPAPGTGDHEDDHETDDDGMIPASLVFEIPLLTGGAAMIVLARRKRKNRK